MSFQKQISKAARTLAMLGAAWALTACGSDNNRQPIIGGPGGMGMGVNCITPGVPAQIGFTGTGIYVDSANVLGGRIPGSWQQFGTMTVGGGGMGGQYNTRPGLVDGQLSMNLNIPGQQPYSFTGMNNQACAFGMCPSNYYQPTNTLGSPLTQQATVTGSILLSEATKTDILNAVAMGRIPVGNMGMNTGYYPPVTGVGGTVGGFNQQVCVTGIAINSGRWDSAMYGRLLYDAKVYLYLNGSQQHGYMLYF